MNIISDLSLITTISKEKLDKLENLKKSLICEYILESIYNKESKVDIDIGIGTLQINYLDNILSYKFTPAKDFDNMIKDSIILKKNYLQELIDTKMCERLDSIYKDLL